VFVCLSVFACLLKFVLFVGVVDISFFCSVFNIDLLLADLFYYVFYLLCCVFMYSCILVGCVVVVVVVVVVVSPFKYFCVFLYVLCVASFFVLFV